MRGTLPVNPLNRVLEEFREWRQPTLMLVGNHDQVWLASHACLVATRCMHAYPKRWAGLLLLLQWHSPQCG